jgi:hypothetical protein
VESNGEVVSKHHETVIADSHGKMFLIFIPKKDLYFNGNNNGSTG